MSQHVALVSGGMDSACAAREAVEEGPADLLVYLDTGTGLDANLEYVREYADWLRAMEGSLDRDDERGEWAWHDDDKSAWAMDDVEEGEQFTLCSTCGGPP